MKIKILNCTQNEFKHVIELRIEQELKPYNSINETIELRTISTNHLSKDEIYTLAYMRVKEKVIKEFQKINYTEEEDNPIGFKLINQKHNSINLNISTEISVLKGKTEELPCSSTILDQYGNFFKDGSVTLAAEYPNITLVNNILSIGDYTGEIILKSSYYLLKESVTINVTQVTKVVTEEEKAIDLVKYLMNDNEFLNSVGITVRT